MKNILNEMFKDVATFKKRWLVPGIPERVPCKNETPYKTWDSNLSQSWEQGSGTRP